LIFSIAGSLFVFSVVGIGLGMFLGCPWISLYGLITIVLVCLSIDALFSQLFIWTSPLAYSLMAVSHVL